MTHKTQKEHFDNGVHPAVGEDYEAIIELACLMADEFGFGFANKRMEYIQKRVAQSLINGPVFVAKKDGEIVGILALYLCQHWFDEESYYADLFFHVKAEHRSSKHAYNLMKTAQKFAVLSGRKLAINAYSPVQLDRLDKVAKYCGFTQAGAVYVYNSDNLLGE